MSIDLQKISGGDTPEPPFRVEIEREGCHVYEMSCKMSFIFLKLCPVLCPVFFVDPALVTVTVIVVTGVLKLFCPSLAGCKLLFIERFILNI